MKQEFFLSALKYSNIVLTGLLLAFPKQFVKLAQAASKKVSSVASSSKQQNEQISNSSASNDGIEHALLAKFKAACKFLRTQNKISINDSLKLYGLFKQATQGNCLDRQPSAILFDTKMKWVSWSKLKDLSKHDAMEQYISLVVTLLPEFSEYWMKNQSIFLLGLAESLNKNDLSDKDLFESSDDEEHQGNYKPKQAKEMRGIGNSISKMSTCLGSEFLEEKPKQVNVSEEVEIFFKLIEEGNKEEIEVLLQNGFNIESPNKQGSTALHYCIEKDQMELLDALLAYFPNINLVDLDGFTALSVAVLNENEEAVAKLLQKGADPSIKDNENHSAYDLANKQIKSIIDKFQEEHS